MLVLRWGEVELVHDPFSYHICSDPFNSRVLAEQFSVPAVYLTWKRSYRKGQRGATGFTQLQSLTKMSEWTQWTCVVTEYIVYAVTDALLCNMFPLCKHSKAVEVIEIHHLKGQSSTNMCLQVSKLRAVFRFLSTFYYCLSEVREMVRNALCSPLFICMTILYELSPLLF